VPVIVPICLSFPTFTLHPHKYMFSFHLSVSYCTFLLVFPSFYLSAFLYISSSCSVLIQLPIQFFTFPAITTVAISGDLFFVFFNSERYASHSEICFSFTVIIPTTPQETVRDAVDRTQNCRVVVLCNSGCC
jgi:hypothetical protein